MRYIMLIPHHYPERRGVSIKNERAFVFILKSSFPSDKIEYTRKGNKGEEMKILVLVKQVCDQADTVSMDSAGEWVVYGGHCVFRMNRYDEYAVEEALRIRERFPVTEIHALSVGPERAQAVIRRAMGMGADHGIHVDMEERGYSSPLERASLIAHAARGRGYDLILAGVMAEDDMESQVGGLAAELLGYRCATSVILQELSRNAQVVRVEREIEGGSREGMTLPLPAVLTVQSGINTPRYPALSHMLKARTAPLERIDAKALSADHQEGTLSKIAPARRAPAGEFLEGSPDQKARRLLQILHENALL
jgi:electron transfer flavoprotein beta subunit